MARCNIFVERLWRTVKYEEIYLKAYTDGRQAKTDLDAAFHLAGSLPRRSGAGHAPG